MSVKQYAEKTFPAIRDAFADVSAFAEEFMETAEIPMRETIQISVALEELFVNVASYAYPEGGGEAELRLSFDGDSLTFELEDGGIAFDPLAKPDPDVTLSAEERSIGGLGIYMVKKSMDEVRYQRINDRNRITVTKKIG